MVHIVSHGSYIPACPLGFPGYKRLKNRDVYRRALFAENEVNGRVYKFIQAQMGIRAPITLNEKTGKNLIHGRCIRNNDTRALNQWLRMGVRGLQQTVNEGWLEKYGYNPQAKR